MQHKGCMKWRSTRPLLYCSSLWIWKHSSATICVPTAAAYFKNCMCSLEFFCSRYMCSLDFLCSPLSGYRNLWQWNMDLPGITRCLHTSKPWFHAKTWSLLSVPWHPWLAQPVVLGINHVNLANPVVWYEMDCDIAIVPISRFFFATSAG